MECFQKVQEPSDMSERVVCSFTTALLVLCAAQEALQPPTFVQKLLNSRALEGDTVSLECKVDASPKPQVFWKKDKEMLRIDPSRMRLVFMSNIVLN